MNTSKPIPTIDSIRCFAFDLDGTLLHSPSVLSNRTQTSLKNLMELKKTIVIASGRIPGEIAHLMKDVELAQYENAYFISYNGGRCEHPLSGEVIYECGFDQETYHDIIIELYRRNLPVHVFCRDTIYLSENMEEVLQIDKNARIGHVYTDLQELHTDFVYKFLILDESEKLNQIREELKKVFPKVEIFKSHSRLLEIVPSGGTKGAALCALTSLIEIPKESIPAFGDEQNDMSMLLAAGYSVAMENSNKALFDIADAIALHHNDDGVAVFLDQLSKKE